MTATPTPLPSPTPPAGTPWATPTPMVLGTPDQPFEIVGGNIQIAEAAVQGYQYANQAGIFDLMWLAIVIFVAVGGTWTIVRRLQRMDT